ncbi:MAG: efflux RND transporter periplasmic adaptor subunit [Candidatus Eisenbacteria bacterium]|nr:efflux RND transporter periplasmic adaptor subunit [Candidatus Eisenbacteria bacterium]
MSTRSWQRTLLLAVTTFALGCAKAKDTASVIPVETAERRDIVLSVEATGTVEPINLVEVKSKASGQIVRMPVEIGSVVEAGELLVQVDTRDVRNEYDQARAALTASEARATIATAQKTRADGLFAGRVITVVERESAVIEDANAQSTLIRARADLDLAQQRLDDATVTAPIAGTVLAKPVSVGQVISSATSSVSGGTTLLSMADLSRVRLRTLVPESDIGRVHAGQKAEVVVDAHSDRTLQGTVEKIEPQAVVQQSVTLFPVLVAIENREGLLMPGMNGEVTIEVDARRDVVAVPIDAVDSAQSLRAVAHTLALDASTLEGGPRARFVVIQDGTGYAIRQVKTGLSDYDYIEIESGLAAGESTVLLAAVELQQKRAQTQEQIRSRVGGVPGMTGGSAGGSSGRSGSGTGTGNNRPVKPAGRKTS